MAKISMKAVLAATALVLGIPGAAQAQSWTLGSWYQYAGNGNFYSVQEITGNTNGWLIAQSQALTLSSPTGGAVNLASVTSAALDAFIFAGVDTPTYWSIDSAGNNEGPNIGGYQYDKLAEPAGDWAWTDGSAWSYTQWAPGEPTNGSGIEDYATLFCNTGSGCRSGNWNDISSGTSAVGTSGSIHYYVAEAIPSAVPEPGAWALMLVGSGVVGWAARRRSGRTTGR
jgi:hypothetical protein